MTTDAGAPLINLLGFITGLILYGMLLWMVLTGRRELNRLALLTGVLGFAWNAGALAAYALGNFGIKSSSPLLLAGAFGALCFLPAVVVHSAAASSEKISRRAALCLAGPAYAMSGGATAMHFYSAVKTGAAPSQVALRVVTVGFGALLVTLLIVTHGQDKRARILCVAAISVFAASALHLSYHQGNDPWWLQLVGHHASLPLALLILCLDLRFVLADIFLKRALAFILLAALSVGLFSFAVSPLLQFAPLSAQSTAVLLAMWVATALAYPFLRRAAAQFVDRIVLNRADYAELGARLSRDIDHCESAGDVLEQTTRALAPALRAGCMDWIESNSPSPHLWLNPDRRTAGVTIPTSQYPHYLLSIRDLPAGRRLLSEDIGMAERAALLAARRIDALRSIEEIRMPLQPASAIAQAASNSPS